MNRMSPRRRAIWRLVRDSGPKGARNAVLAAHVDLPVDDDRFRIDLQQLHAGGYIRRLQPRTDSGWVTSHKVPAGEQLEVGATGVGLNNVPPRPFAAITDTDFKYSLGAAPSSIFHLAQLIGAHA